MPGPLPRARRTRLGAQQPAPRGPVSVGRLQLPTVLVTFVDCRGMPGTHPAVVQVPPAAPADHHHRTLCEVHLEAHRVPPTTIRTPVVDRVSRSNTFNALVPATSVEMSPLDRRRPHAQDASPMLRRVATSAASFSAG